MAEKDEATYWRGEGDKHTGRVRLSGEIDFTNSLEVRDWLRAFMAECDQDISLNLADLEYIDSSGLAVLIAARKCLKSANHTIKVDSASSQVQKLFSLTQIGELFGI